MTTKQTVKQTPDEAAKLRALFEYYAGTPSKKWPLRVGKDRKGKPKVFRRTQREWAEMLGITRSYLSKVLNNEDGFRLTRPERFAGVVAHALNEAFAEHGLTFTAEDCWDLDASNEPTR